jgi:GDP-L-fucose synthase
MKNAKIYVAGHTGLIGSAVVRKLLEKNYRNILTVNKKDLDLRNQSDVYQFLKSKKPDFIIMAAAKVGGIFANNKYRAEFIYDNLAMQNNLIHGSFKAKVKNLIFLGSSCIYPKFAKQPLKEDCVMSGPLEYTNEPYAVAKIAGLKLCENYNLQYKTNYKCLMPSNLFGPSDNYNSDNSHFFPAIIKKLYIAKIKNYKKIIFWGTGQAKREMTYVDDLAEAIIFFLRKKTKATLINIGSGYEKKIKDYVKYVSKKMNIKNRIVFDKNKEMDGMRRKIVNTTVAKKYGFYCKHSFNEAFDIVYKDFLLNKKKYLNM